MRQVGHQAVKSVVKLVSREKADDDDGTKYTQFEYQILILILDQSTN